MQLSQIGSKLEIFLKVFLVTFFENFMLIYIRFDR